jgi:hypothetical protein
LNPDTYIHKPIFFSSSWHLFSPHVDESNYQNIHFNSKVSKKYSNFTITIST